MRVNGVSGRWIELHTRGRYKSDREVIFSRDTRFKVKKYRVLSKTEIEIDFDEVK